MHSFWFFSFNKFDFSISGENPKPDIVKLYSAKEEYGLTDLSPASWYDLLNRWVHDGSLYKPELS